MIDADRLAELAALPADWDSYGGEPISAEALATAAAIALVPLADGGVQIELHAGGADVEIEIDAQGRVVDVYHER